MTIAAVAGRAEQSVSVPVQHVACLNSFLLLEII